MTTMYDDKRVLVITTENGDLQLDRQAKYAKGRCKGLNGFKEQIAILKELYGRTQ